MLPVEDCGCYEVLKNSDMYCICSINHFKVIRNPKNEAFFISWHFVYLFVCETLCECINWGLCMCTFLFIMHVTVHTCTVRVYAQCIYLTLCRLALLADSLPGSWSSFFIHLLCQSVCECSSVWAQSCIKCTS